MSRPRPVSTLVDRANVSCAFTMKAFDRCAST